MERYKLLGESDKESISNRFQSSIQDWLNKWVGQDTVNASIFCENLFNFKSSESGKIYNFTFGNNVIYMIAGEGDVRGLANLMLRLSDVEKQLYEFESNSYIERLAQDSISDYLSHVVGGDCSQYGVCDTDECFAHVYKGKGFAQTIMKVNDISLGFIFSASLIVEKAVVGSASELKMFDLSMLVNDVVSLEASVKSENIRLVDLLEISVGDVLVLDHKINQPLELRVNGCKSLPVELGGLNGNRCVRFVG